MQQRYDTYDEYCDWDLLWKYKTDMTKIFSSNYITINEMRNNILVHVEAH